MVLNLDVKLHSSCIILSLLSSLPPVICHPSLLPQAPEQDEVLQSIDRAIEGIHNVAMKNGGKYNLEQRDVLQWVHIHMFIMHTAKHSHLGYTCMPVSHVALIR